MIKSFQEYKRPSFLFIRIPVKTVFRQSINATSGIFLLYQILVWFALFYPTEISPLVVLKSRRPEYLLLQRESRLGMTRIFGFF